MKHFFLTALAFVCIAAAKGQTNTAIPDYGNTTPAMTPNTLTSRFNADYPNNNPTWSNDGTFYRADYTDVTTNNEHYITYDKDGNVIMRGEHIAPTQYPTAINDYYTKTYPREEYSVWSRQDKAGNTSYYIDRNYETLWFDTNGKYKTTTKTKNAKSRKTTK